MPVEPEGSLCVLQYGWEGPVRKHNFHNFQPRPRELDAIPEHAQVVHGGVQDGWTAPESCKVPPVFFDNAACEAEGLPQTQNLKVEHIILALIEEMYSGERSRVTERVAQLRIATRWELELVAQILVEKAFAEPQYSEACAVLACTLQRYLPAVPRATTRQGNNKKAEKFMHALLDVFQTVFEDIFLNPHQQQIEKTGPIYHDSTAALDRNLKERTVLQFAAHLHHWGLLGEKVVSQMVHDLIDSGAVEMARELLQVVGIVRDHP